MKRLALLIFVILFLSTNKINGAVQEKFFDFWPRMQENVPPNQWVQLPSPGGGWINDIKIAPSDQNRMFVSTIFGGIFRSDDAGAHWVNTDRRFANFGCAPFQATKIAIDPRDPDWVYSNTNVFDSNTRQFYLLKSTHGGDPWQIKSQPEEYFTYPLEPLDIVTYPKDGRHLYSGSEDFSGYPAELERSDDYGKTWHGAGHNQGLELVAIPAILPDQNDPEKLLVGGDAYLSPDEIWRIDPNNGITQWTPSSDGLTYSKCDSRINVIVRDPINPSRLYAAGENHPSSIYTSEDAGLTWQPIGTGFEPDVYCSGSSDAIYDLAIAPDEPNVLFAMGRLGIYRSKDSGTTWMKLVGHGVPDIDFFEEGTLAIQSQPPYALFAGFQDYLGLFVSYDRGETWQTTNDGLSSSGVLDIDQNPDKPYEFLTSVLHNGVYRSDAQGNWTKVFPKDPGTYYFGWPQPMARDPHFPNTIYFAHFSDDYSTPEVSVTENWGETWEDRSAGLEETWVTEFAFSAQNPDIVYVLNESNNHVYRTITAGREGWEPAQNIGLENVPGAESFVDVGPVLAVDPWDDQILILGTPRRNRGPISTVFLSNDAGDNWRGITPPNMGDIDILTVAFDPAHRGVIFAGGFDVDTYTPGRLFRRDIQGGGQWEEIILPLSTWVQHIFFDPNHPESMYVTGQGYVFHSLDSGATWEALAKKGFYFNSPTNYAVDMNTPNRLYAGTFSSGMLGYWQEGAADLSVEYAERDMMEQLKTKNKVVDRPSRDFGIRPKDNRKHILSVWEKQSP